MFHDTRSDVPIHFYSQELTDRRNNSEEITSFFKKKKFFRPYLINKKFDITKHNPKKNYLLLLTIYLLFFKIFIAYDKCCGNLLYLIFFIYINKNSKTKQNLWTIYAPSITQIGTHN